MFERPRQTTRHCNFWAAKEERRVRDVRRRNALHFQHVQIHSASGSPGGRQRLCGAGRNGAQNAQRQGDCCSPGQRLDPEANDESRHFPPCAALCYAFTRGSGRGVRNEEDPSGWWAGRSTAERPSQPGKKDFGAGKGAALHEEPEAEACYWFFLSFPIFVDGNGKFWCCCCCCCCCVDDETAETMKAAAEDFWSSRCEKRFRGEDVKKRVSVTITTDAIAMCLLTFVEWKDSSAVLSEAELEKLLNKDGLRYRMNRTEKESEGLAGRKISCGPRISQRKCLAAPRHNPSFPTDIGPTLKLGPLELKPPKVESIWEALGFTATGTNEASLKAKEEWKKGLKNNTYKFARFSKEEKDEWRQKYGYDRAYGEQ
eukprot:scaffold1087_cov198-Pinguiococcus_pyrenoidosus.AAC.17